MYFKPSQGFFFLIAGIFLVFLLSGAANGEVVGKFTYVEGTVDVLKGGKLPAFRVSLGDPVSEGDIVRTKSQSKAEITFMDGSILKIAQRTRIDIEEYLSGTKASLKLPRGKVEALVPPHLAKKIEELPDKHKFEIKTPIAVAGVRGTDFFSFHQPAFSGVIVKEGVVQVYNLRFPEVKVRVSANEMTIVREARPPELPRPAPKEEIERHEKDVGPTVKKEVGEVTAPAAVEKPSAEKPREERAPSEAAPERTVREEEARAVSPALLEVASLTEAKTVLSEATPSTQPTPSPATPISPVTVPITEVISSLDTTPPKLEFTSKPNEVTNSQSANFSVFCDDTTATLTYKLDGKEVSSLTFSGLSEGTHTFEVIAKDQAGNSSSISYSWTIDLTPPSITLHPHLKPVPFYKADLEIGVESSEPFTYSISPEPKGLGEGTHLFEVVARDRVGNETRETLSFDLKAYGLDGNFYLSGSNLKGTVSGQIASVKGKDWGGTVLSMEANEQIREGAWSLYAGGKGFDSSTTPQGYFLLEGSGTTSQTSIEGRGDLTFLTPDLLGKASGDIRGTYQMKTTLAHEGISYSEIPLSFGTAIGVTKGTGFASLDENASLVFGQDVTNLTGLIGGQGNPWDSASNFFGLGKYENPEKRKLWAVTMVSKDPLLESGDPCTSNIACQNIAKGGDAFRDLSYLAFVGGIAKDGKLEGFGEGIYVKEKEGGPSEAGYLTVEEFSGDLHREIGMWKAEGKMSAKKMEEGNFSRENLYPDSTDLDTGSSDGFLRGEGITGKARFQSLALSGRPWGILAGGASLEGNPSQAWHAAIGGIDRDTGPDYVNPSYWIANVSGSSSDGKVVATLYGDYLSDEGMGKIEGRLIGVSEDGKTECLIGGKWKEEPLGFAGGVGVLDGNGFQYWDREMQELGKDSETTGFTGLIGGTYDFFSGTTGFLAIGRYKNPNQRKLFFVDALRGYDKIVSNPESNPCDYNIGCQRPFLKGESVKDSAILGAILGIVSEKNIEGNIGGLYIRKTGDEEYTAGYFTGLAEGNLYPDLSSDLHMWRLQGMITTKDMGKTSFAPDYLYSLELEEKNSHVLGLLGGDIKGKVEGQSLRIPDQEFGIWAIGGGGSYETEPGQNWKGYFGFQSGDSYSIGHIEGEWWQNGTFSGKVRGKSLDETSLSEFDGRILGVYSSDDKNFETIGSGSFVSSPLLHLGKFYGQTLSGLIEVKRGEYTSGSGDKYQYWYAADNSTGGSYYESASGDSVYIYYSADKTYLKVTCTGNTCNYEEGNWDPQAFQLSVLETPPDNSNFVLKESETYYSPHATSLYGLLGSVKGISSGSTSLYLAGSQPLSVTGSVVAGEFASWNGMDQTVTYDGSAYKGFLGGKEKDGILNLILSGLYMDKDKKVGFLTGKLWGSSYADIGMFEAEGFLRKVEMEQGQMEVKDFVYSLNQEFFYGKPATEFKIDNSDLKDKPHWIEATTLTFPPSSFGVWREARLSTYEGVLPSGSWSSYAELTRKENGQETGVLGTLIEQREWSMAEIPAKAFGFGASLSSEPVTWIHVGESVGTFDPNKSIFEMYSTGFLFETKKFLSLVGSQEGLSKLSSLNVPAYEVGKVSLSGQGNGLEVHMDDVVFLAPLYGEKPKIWGTEKVYGTIQSPPVLNQSTTLRDSAGNFSVNFTPVYWDSNKWLSKVSGSGRLQGERYTGDISMQGAAAGKINGNSFSGTAAGIVK